MSMLIRPIEPPVSILKDVLIGVSVSKIHICSFFLLQAAEKLGETTSCHSPLETHWHKAFTLS